MARRVAAVVLAAGRGERFGGPVAKPFTELGGRTLLARSVDSLRASEVVTEVVVVVPPGFLETAPPAARHALESAGADRVVEGGARRQDSSRNGVHACSEEAELILIHDAARPFASPALVRAVVEAAAEFGVAAPALAARDSVKKGGGGFLLRSLPRSVLYLTQTPQGFRRHLLLRSLEEVRLADIDVTDDVEMAELAGLRARIVPGEPLNLKITTPEDLPLARCILSLLQPPAGTPGAPGHTGRG